MELNDREREELASILIPKYKELGNLIQKLLAPPQQPPAPPQEPKK